MRTALKLNILLAGLLIGLAFAAGAMAAHPEAANGGPSFRDFKDHFAAGELIVMFRDDTGVFAREGLSRGFAQATGRSAASSLDDLMRAHSVRKVRRVFRALEDGSGALWFTARDR